MVNSIVDSGLVNTVLLFYPLPGVAFLKSTRFPSSKLCRVHTTGFAIGINSESFSDGTPTEFHSSGLAYTRSNQSLTKVRLSRTRVILSLLLMQMLHYEGTDTIANYLISQYFYCRYCISKCSIMYIVYNDESVRYRLVYARFVYHAHTLYLPCILKEQYDSQLNANACVLNIHSAGGKSK
ncbi:hypothetical protein AB205_0139910 [Aquarana catesbeiana]|uniref:Uncharacterized protein n=1 Tax=Aquarana catesbeiana TaxID=8400 RepID=A0A2G9S9F3_AQUCT|nr:hypothetical protein AB205_0139910 [Aquarana catesbeiana]